MKKILKSIFYLFYYLINSMEFRRKKVLVERGWSVMGRLRIVNLGKLIIGENFKANSGRIYNPIGGDTYLSLFVNKGAVLIIGKEVGISNSSILCSNMIKIGDNVIIGGSCRIWDTDFHSLDPLIRTRGADNDVNSSPIKIMDNCFIGGGSTILKGVTIGQNSIIGACSVVTKSIPANQIWAGNPAKFIRAL